ncbi:MAG: hypothetical protein Q7U98_18200 [Methylicorpusculum sp.]|uniref:hypothetical protein n=1 Tax=Methylicorpusculum sp. TaxID=2713644 RepID=UPI0027173FEA|nr:hypothetical protein [Methylicorpusculum sp.]MDO8941090.1 hypothetical protein [Methylicorpusculum sp.]MDP2202253.1 hypothetical protein [Methylicorpusculum sp.]
MRALSKLSLPYAASGLVNALLAGDPDKFDKLVTYGSARAVEIWHNYTTRSGILSRTSEFRRVVEKRAIERVLAQLDNGLQAWEKRVCMVKVNTSESEPGNERSFVMTGFLVSADLVLTSGNHLGQSLVDNPIAVAPKFLFDYRVLSDGTPAGPPLEVPATIDGPVAFSPPEQVHYALYRLASPIGSERGWADLSSTQNR